MLDAAETLFITSKSRFIKFQRVLNKFHWFKVSLIFSRVYGSAEKAQSSKKPKLDEQPEKLLDFDDNPKWIALSEIMVEIRQEIGERQDSSDELSEDKILIFTSDQRVANQVEDFLFLGSEALLTRMINRTLMQESLPERRHFKHPGQGKKGQLQTLTISDRADMGDDENTRDEPHLPSNFPLVRSLQVGAFQTFKLLEEYQPRYVILYDVQISAVRQLEVFHAKNSHFKVLDETNYHVELIKFKDFFLTLLAQSLLCYVCQFCGGAILPE